MNQRQDFFAKSAWGANFSGGTIRTQKAQKSSSIWLIILVLLVLGAGGFGYLWYQDSIHLDILTPETDIAVNPYAIGNAVQIEGTMTEDNSDLLSHTHMLMTSDGSKFFLKSSQISLNNYSTTLSGMVQILGTVYAVHQEIPVIEVSTIGTQLTSAQESSTTPETEPTAPLGMYLSKAGLYFSPEFFEQFAFIGQAGENGKIQIKNLENEKITTISYFNCSNNGDTNCQELSKTFQNTAVKTSTTLNGDTFYELETKSRFVQNNNRRGYFINDAETEEVERIKNLITFANPEVIKQIISRYGVKACLGKDDGLHTITSHTVKKTASGLTLTLKGSGEKHFSCQAELDLSKATKLNFLDIQIEENKANADIQTGSQISAAETEKKESEKADASTKTTTQVATTQASTYNPNVPQFPTNAEKTLTYTSSRWGYKMTFPSMNISFEATSVERQFGASKCNYAVRVVQHKNKEQLSTAPALTIYECKNNPNLTPDGENFLIKELGDKKFVFEIHDGAWLQFAQETSIESL